MKNKIAILSLSALALGSLAPTPAAAGNREWATVAKVHPRVTVVHPLGHAFPPPVYVSAPVYVQPARVVVVPRPVCAVPAPVCLAPPVCVPRFCPPPFVRFGLGLRLAHHPHSHWR